MLPKKLQEKLNSRETNNALRKLLIENTLVDFSSNDYLGFSKSEAIFNASHLFLKKQGIIQNGATGSRLISGNHALYDLVEQQISKFHNSQSALIFNSGYNANIGFFSSVPQRGDLILYDELIHASIRDGISMSNAKAYKFKHNNLQHLDKLLKRIENAINIYVVTESVFSMDGDSPNLTDLSLLCKKHQAFLIVDEAHALGIFGKNGEGLTQNLNLEHDVFARIITFGKGLGCHGAAILGSSSLKQYLVNFSRSFIYTTALPPHSLATIHTAYKTLKTSNEKDKLLENIQFLKYQIIKNNLNRLFIESDSAIHCCIISGNDTVKSIAKNLLKHNFNIKPILSPTVAKGQERLRICLHSYNTKKEIENLLKTLTTFVDI